jgi:hypothetical protein
MSNFIGQSLDIIGRLIPLNANQTCLVLVVVIGAILLWLFRLAWKWRGEL